MAISITTDCHQPLPSPPPAYLQPSSPSLSRLSGRPVSVSVTRKSLPASSPTPESQTTVQSSSGTPVLTDRTMSLTRPSAAQSEGANDAYGPPVTQFSGIILDDAGGLLSQSDSKSVTGHQDSFRHTSASSDSWSMGNQDNSQRLGKEGGSYFAHDPQSSSSRDSMDSMTRRSDNYEPLHYHHQIYQSHKPERKLGAGDSRANSTGHLSARLAGQRRPVSAYSSVSDLNSQGRNLSPRVSSYARPPRHSASSPDVRPMSFVDLLSAPYPQAGPAPVQLDNAHLRSSVGNNASLLSHKQTFNMYLANVKKTDDPAVQYEFAVFMINSMTDIPPSEHNGDKNSVYETPGQEITPSMLLQEAKSILQRLADRSYPFAQYYLGDGHASGLFSKGKEDYDRAFSLFVAASKHGHVEACYRAALCYEFGWGTSVQAARAQQFYRQAASKNHPGAMLRMAKACLSGDMGLGKRYREGIKWMKRAAESSDAQYNSAPYELGLLHEIGYGDDVFCDPSYAAQLFTKSADLGHVEASYRLGDAYEHGKLSCPRDPALSIHFYTGAARKGHPHAMMALCAWYLVGAEPVLERNEDEAYEWAKRAAELGLAKAEYAVGYFTEMGVGCRRDPLEANVWYVKAAEQGDERARHRIATIRAAAEGTRPRLGGGSTKKGEVEGKGKARGNKVDDGDKAKPKRFGIF